MPFYFDVGLAAGSTNQSYTTNGAGNTETDHILGIAAATFGFSLAELIANAINFATVGGWGVRVKTAGTSAAGTAATASKRNPNGPAANSTWSTGITAAGTPLTRLAVGAPQTGGQGVDIAPVADAAVQCAAGTGNKMEFFSIAFSISVPVHIAPIISEGGTGN